MTYNLQLTAKSCLQIAAHASTQGTSCKGNQHDISRLNLRGEEHPAERERHSSKTCRFLILAVRSECSWNQFVKKRMIQIAIVLALFALVGLKVLSAVAKRPDDLGVHNGKLTACPPSPSCVCSQCDIDVHQMDPWNYQGTANDAITAVQSVLNSYPRTSLIETEPRYVRAESKSLVFGFVDDLEFFIDDVEQKVHFRSASRVGKSDFGVNRSRMQKLHELFQQVSHSPQHESRSR